MTLKYQYCDTRIGRLLLVADDDALCIIGFPEGKGKHTTREGWQQKSNPVIKLALEQITAYLDGKLQAFDVPLHISGTDFQQEVYQALQAIPYGKTISYQELAEMVGRPKAVRAVGNANGRNPIPLIVPCHRVIGSNGSLTGFGGGIALKKRLLDLESYKYQYDIEFS